VAGGRNPGVATGRTDPLAATPCSELDACKLYPPGAAPRCPARFALIPHVGSRHRFTFTWTLLLLQCLANLAGATICAYFSKSVPPVPATGFVVPATTYILAMLTSNEALRSVGLVWLGHSLAWVHCAVTARCPGGALLASWWPLPTIKCTRTRAHQRAASCCLPACLPPPAPIPGKLAEEHRGSHGEALPRAWFDMAVTCRHHLGLGAADAQIRVLSDSSAGQVV